MTDWPDIFRRLSPEQERSLKAHAEAMLVRPSEIIRDRGDSGEPAICNRIRCPNESGECAHPNRCIGGFPLPHSDERVAHAEERIHVPLPDDRDFEVDGSSSFYCYYCGTISAPHSSCRCGKNARANARMCPWHVSLCIGPRCCCADAHDSVAPPSPDPAAATQHDSAPSARPLPATSARGITPTTSGACEDVAAPAPVASVVSASQGRAGRERELDGFIRTAKGLMTEKVVCAECGVLVVEETAVPLAFMTIHRREGCPPKSGHARSCHSNGKDGMCNCDYGEGHAVGCAVTSGLVNCDCDGPDEAINPACSFCDKPRSAVAKLISGPRVQICDECVQLSAEICGFVEVELPLAIGDRVGVWIVSGSIKRLHAGTVIELGDPPAVQLDAAGVIRSGMLVRLPGEWK